MNISDNSALRSCTSCQMCGAVCPKDAITICLDVEGFYRPIIDKNKCIDCGKCVKVCYKFDSNIHISSNDQLLNTRLYACSAISQEVISATTSGGIGDLLVNSLINNGYTVIGVIYNSILNRAEDVLCSSIDEAKLFRGSKYIQSFTIEAFKIFVKNCKQTKFAVFGLPCHIYAISRYLQSIHFRDNVLLIDLFCHGCPSMLSWHKTSDSIKEKLGADSFSYVNWRSKCRGWGDFVLEVKGNNGKRFVSSPLNSVYYDLFFSNLILNSSCIDCKLRGTLEYTDIRLGDFWGHEYSKTTRGVSGVSVVTKRGAQLFSKISHLMSCEEKSINVFLPYQSWSHVYKIDKHLRKKLFDLLIDESVSLVKISSVLNSTRSRKQKIKRYVKQILFYLPLTVTIILRRYIK